jgi:hypothetical protein
MLLFFYAPVMLGAFLWNIIACLCSHYIQCVTAWAVRQPDMRGVCVFALGDYAEKTGLLNSAGRKRQAYLDYQRLSTVRPK